MERVGKVLWTDYWTKKVHGIVAYLPILEKKKTCITFLHDYWGSATYSLLLRLSFIYINCKGKQLQIRI
jgi:hypothetical protein